MQHPVICTSLNLKFTVGGGVLNKFYLGNFDGLLNELGRLFENMVSEISLQREITSESRIQLKCSTLVTYLSDSSISTTPCKNVIVNSPHVP